ncbi:MAG: GxxExxY protein [Planctomycetota bacterium]|nr:GxxExxY protein [Planctomycetaceae bacterium]MDQ3331978.1 GxxExxY protein [Planctomycetota bacterium]
MTVYEPPSNRDEEIAREVVDAAIRLPSALGPGLLESAYEQCLQHELARRGLRAARQVPVPIIYEGTCIETGFRLDLLVEDLVIVELKAVEAMIPLYDAQILTHLKLTGKHIGFLINFNVPRLKSGLKRFVRTPSS